jgi:hypothetical protein
LFGLDLGRPDEAGAHTRSAWLRHVELVDDVLNERLVFGWHVTFDGLATVVFGHAIGQDEIHAERLVTDKPSDLGKLVGDFMREPPGGAVDTEPSGIGYGGNGPDVMGEAEHRVFDAEASAHVGG